MLLYSLISEKIKQISVKAQSYSVNIYLLGCSAKYTRDNTGLLDEVQPSSCGIWTAIPPSIVNFFFKIFVHDVLLRISSSC